jgi:hypothetical protein
VGTLKRILEHSTNSDSMAGALKGVEREFAETGFVSNFMHSSSSAATASSNAPMSAQSTGHADQKDRHHQEQVRSQRL